MIDLTKKDDQYDDLDIPDFDTIDDANTEIDNAQHALFRLKQAYQHNKKVIDVFDDVDTTSPDWEILTEHDLCETLDHCSMDIAYAYAQHLKKQIRVVRQYIQDIEAWIADVDTSDPDELRKDYFASVL